MKMISDRIVGIIIAILLTYPLFLSSETITRDMLQQPCLIYADGLDYSGQAEYPDGKKQLWEIGPREDIYRCPANDEHCPINKNFFFILSDTYTQNISDFPCGMAVNHECLPSSISIDFMFEKAYSEPKLSILMNGKGRFSAYYDTNLIFDGAIDSGFGWEEINNGIRLPYINSGEHNIIIALKHENDFIVLKHLLLTGYPDTDTDGINDCDEAGLDSDNDGLPDYQDADCTMIPLPEIKKRLLLMTRPAIDGQGAGTPKLQMINKKDILNTDDLMIPSEQSLGVKFFYGPISGVITNLDLNKDSHLILVPYIQGNTSTELMPSLYGIEQVWAKQQQNGEWICLDAGIDTKTTKITLLLSDNGITDLDQSLNNRISFSLLIAIPSTLETYEADHCFISTAGGNILELPEGKREKGDDL